MIVCVNYFFRFPIFYIRRRLKYLDMRNVAIVLAISSNVLAVRTSPTRSIKTSFVTALRWSKNTGYACLMKSGTLSNVNTTFRASWNVDSPPDSEGHLHLYLFWTKYSPTDRPCTCLWCSHQPPSVGLLLHLGQVKLLNSFGNWISGAQIVTGFLYG